MLNDRDGAAHSADCPTPIVGAQGLRVKEVWKGLTFFSAGSVTPSASLLRALRICEAATLVDVFSKAYEESHVSNGSRKRICKRAQPVQPRKCGQLAGSATTAAIEWWVELGTNCRKRRRSCVSAGKAEVEEHVYSTKDGRDEPPELLISPACSVLRAPALLCKRACPGSAIGTCRESFSPAPGEQAS